jgi:CDP-diacylglycerol---serine O-phosphatidyltransferase
MNTSTKRRSFWRFLPANIATCSSLAVAMISVTLSFHNDLTVAAWCILYCVLLDKLDGLLARFFKAQSDFGMELDSFVDFAAFGLAPAALCWNFVTGGSIVDAWSSPISYIAIIYAIATVLRLVRFNVTQDDLPDNLFLGVPSTVCGGAIAATFLTIMNTNMATQPHTVAYVLMISLLAGAILMLSNFKMLKVGGSKHKWFNAVILIAIIAAYLAIIFNVHPEYIVALALAYIISGLIFNRSKT